MKSVILVCVLFAVTSAYGHTIQLDQSQKELATKHTTECIKETGVNPEVLANAKKGQLIDDEGLKKFTLCFFQKAGITDHDGKLNIETALSKLPAGVDKVEAQKVLESCQSQTEKNAADTVFEAYKCYRQKISTPASLGI